MSNIRKIGRNSQGTYYVTLPREIVQSLKLRAKQKVTIKEQGSSIIIEDFEN